MLPSVDGLDAARARLQAAEVVAVLTGAGISTASGIPDFRGPEGIWTKDPAAEMLSTYDVWVRDPEVRRRAWRQRVATRAHRPEPNAGHRALVEIHGSTREAVCLRCGDRGPIDAVLDRVAGGDEVPACRRPAGDGPCGGILKSATISFGQSLVEADLARAEAAATRCDVLLVVGSTLAVWPIAGMVPIARRWGAEIVIVNGEPTEMDAYAAVLVPGAIETVLPVLVDGLSAL